MSPEMKNNIGGFNWNVYNAPDVFNPSLHPPKGAIDVLNIVEAGVEFKPVLSPDYTDFYKQPIFANPPKVTPGKGIQLHTKASSHLCDGSVDSFCDRGGSNICLLYGHNDERGGLLFSSYSGWVVMNLPDLIHGQIVIKYHSWKSGSDIPRISDWTSINNERSLLSDTSPQLLSNLTLVPPGNISKVHDHRILKKGKKKEEGCTTMVFEFAIDGKVTSWKTGDKFSEMYQRPQRVVETLTLLDDPNFTGGIAKEVEVAIRMTGCEHKKAFELTHIYWA